MKHQKAIYILICFLLLNTFLQTTASGAEVWYQVKTNNFNLIGNADKKQIARVGIKLEQFREVIQQIAPTISKESPIATTVIVFKDNASFHPYKPHNDKGEITDWVAGFFQSGLDVNYIALSFDSKNNAFQTIFHEYTHNLLDYNLGQKNIPPWFSEGLAEYYDQFSIDNDRVVKLGGKHIPHFEILKRSGLIPMDVFFKTTYSDLRSKNQTQANQFYAQSWALIHYLMRRDSGASKYQIEKFAELLKANQNPDISFYQSFGLSHSGLESNLQNYIEKGITKPNLIKFEDKLATKLKIENSYLERSEVLANLGDLLYQRGRFEESEKLLIEALKIDPESAFANSTLGLVRMKQHQFSEARKYFQKVNTANSQNYLTYYRFAYFLSREVITFDNYISNYSDDRTLQMRRALLNSVSLNQKFPDSYSLLAFINLVRNEDFDEGIKYLKKAIELDSRKETYQINLAKLYLRKNDFLSAQSIAENLVQNSPDDNLKKRAGDIIEEILFIQKKIKEEKNLTNNLSINSVYKKGKTANRKSNVLSEEDLERNRRQTQSEAISEVLIQPKTDEKRIIGKISEVNCVGKKVVLTILSDNQIKKLRSIGFNNLLLKTFTSEMRGANFGCGIEGKDVLAVMIYKPNLEKKDNTLGEIISIEFVPKNFVLSVNQ